MVLWNPSQAQPSKVILCLGDSLTAGYGVPLHASYPALLQSRLQKAGYTHQVINAGVSGDTTAGALRRLGWALRSQPSIAIVALGANDGLRGLDLKEMKRNLSKILDQLQQSGVRPILAGMRIPPNYGHHYTERFATIYTELAKEKNIPLLPFLLEQVAGHPELNQSDGIHPNAAGYKIVIENVWEVLKVWLP